MKKYNNTNEAVKDVKKLYNEFPYPNHKYSLEELDKHKWILNTLPFPIKEGSKILDAGCGTGDITCFLSRYGKVTGIDFNKRSLELARENSKRLGLDIEFMEEDLTNIQHKEKYDYIFSNGVIHHIPEMAKAIEQLKDHLKDDGHMVLIVYNKYGWVLHKLFPKYFERKIRKQYSLEETKIQMMDSYGHPHDLRYGQKEFSKILKHHNLNIVNIWRDIPEIVRLLTAKGVVMTFCVTKK